MGLDALLDISSIAHYIKSNNSIAELEGLEWLQRQIARLFWG
jgi:hypothetical protein